MIPKIIHYCWLSNDPYPEKIAYCLESWKKILPDYEIRLWDTHRFDINSVPWVKEAFDAKKYAFAADYIRCYALYHEGGIYLDSDVEVLRPYDDLLNRSYFIGHERNTTAIEAATLGFEPHHELFKYMLQYYENRHFVTHNGLDTLPLPQVMQKVIEQYNIQLDVLPSDYFSPKVNEQLNITCNTYSVHHYTATWRSPIYNKIRMWTLRLMGVKGKERIANVLRKLGKKY